MNKFRNGDVGYTVGDFEQLQSELEAVKAERDNLIKGDWTPDQYHAIIKSKNIQQLSLEQQAQGVEDLRKEWGDTNFTNVYTLFAHQSLKLRKQAKELRGGKC